jgi:hypothetical protein
MRKETGFLDDVADATTETNGIDFGRGAAFDKDLSF